jgi:hypothetical protein
MGEKESIQSSFQLLRESWSFVRYNKDLLLFPFFSSLGLCGIIALFLNVITSEIAIQLTVADGTFPSLIRIATIFLFWFFVVFNFVFFSAACLGIIYYRMVERQSFSLLDGIYLAGRRSRPLALWAVLWACGFTVLSFAARWISRSGWVERLFFVSAEFLNALTWFVLPVVVIERKGLLSSIQDSKRLFTDNWGSMLVFRYSVASCFLAFYGGVFAILMAVTLIFATMTGLPDNPNIWGKALTLAWAAYIPLFIFVLLVQAVFSGVVRIALYQYATKRQIVPNFNGVTLLGSVGTRAIGVAHL